MNCHDAAAALQELVEVHAVLRFDAPAFLGVEHDHIGVLQLFGGREGNCTVHFRAAVGEQLLPILQKSWPVVLAVAGGAVGLSSGADKNSERRIGGKHGGADGEQNDGQQS